MFTLNFFKNSIIDATQNKVMRRIIGWIILTIPAIVILFGLIGKDSNPANWWNSISATYYTNSNALMVSLIAICAFFFCTYPGYSLGDRIVNRISGLGLFAILIFPCGDYNLPCPEKVGVFLLKKEISTIPHSICALVAFVAFAVNLFFFFTKNNGAMTKKKIIRNVIYRVCAIIIPVVGGFFILMDMIGPDWVPHWFILVGETVSLMACGIAWLVKGEVFKFLND